MLQFSHPISPHLLREVPIAGEVISRRPKGAASRAHHKADLDLGPGIWGPQRYATLQVGFPAHHIPLIG